VIEQLPFRLDKGAQGSQVLPLPHLIKVQTSGVDSLEFARGALCAASFVATNAASETRVATLHNLFERAGLAATMADALETMQFLREAEPLGGGYWIPTPVRTVDLGSDRCLLVGPQPTSELQRHFAGVRRAGAGRVMDRADVPESPSEADTYACACVRVAGRFA